MDRECPYDVFISHSSKDKSIADAVCASLETAKIRCWVAPRDILPGMEWGESIVDAINSSKIMVIIFSSNSNNSKQVAREVESAVRKGLQIIPFRIEDINPTGSMEYYLYTQHWMDAITPPMQHHIDQLVKAVKEYLDPKGLKEPNPDKVFTSDNLKKRSPIVNPLFLGLAVLCIVGAVIAGSLLLK
ncbi:MAG: toll/interleukin-1 receptor domain-containing protein, partial [Ignavibacteriales bacterium]